MGFKRKMIRIAPKIRIKRYQNHFNVILPRYLGKFFHQTFWRYVVHITPINPICLDFAFYEIEIRLFSTCG